MEGSEAFNTETPTKFMTKPDTPKNFNITLNNNNATIEWELGEGGFKTLIKRKLNECPTLDEGSGEVIYFDTDIKTEDLNIPDGTYCYNAWTMNYDDLTIIYSNPVEKTIQLGTSSGGTTTIITTETPTETEEPEKTETITYTEDKTTTTSVQKDDTSLIKQIYNLSINTYARNISFENLQWGQEIEMLDNNEIEAIIQIKNTGSATLTNISIKNSIDEKIGNIKNVIINDIVYPNKILDNAFIKRLKPNETIKITFSGTVSNVKNGETIFILSEIDSNETSKITDIIKIEIKDKISFEDLNAGFFSMLMVSGWCPWIILSIIILILIIIYLVIKKRKKIIKE